MFVGAASSAGAQSTTYPPPSGGIVTDELPSQVYYPQTHRYYPSPTTDYPAPSSYSLGYTPEPQIQPAAPQRYYPQRPYYETSPSQYGASGRYYPAPRPSFSMAPRRAPTPEEQALLAWLPEHTRQEILQRLSVDQTAQGILETMVLNRLVLDYAESRNMRWNGYGFVADVRPVDTWSWIEVEYDPVTETYRKVRDLN
jgi:hypothetical protein